MLQLPNGCRSSTPTIYPVNWNRASATIKKTWYVQYYFYNGTERKLCIVKGGLNRFKTVVERRAAAKALLAEVTELLHEGYNPITKTIVTPLVNAYNIDEYAPWIPAIIKISEHLKVEHSTARDLACYLKKIKVAADNLRISNVPICQLSRRHIKQVLMYLEEKNGISAHAYNKCRSYLMMLFKELLECDLVEYNPVRDIAKRKVIKRLREVLTDEQRTQVNDHLKTNHYSFWRFTQIFFHSGARIKEILAVKVSDVDIGKQRFKILIKKGAGGHEEWRVIKNIALPFWLEVLENAKPTDFVFSVGLEPGPQEILREQITRRWWVHVKKKLGINADFYSLKHLNLDEISGELDIHAAANMAGHTTPVITLKHYAVGEKAREMERLKKVNNKFA